MQQKERTKSVQYNHAIEILSQTIDTTTRRATIQADALEFQQVMERMEHLDRKNSKMDKIIISMSSKGLTTSKSGIVAPVKPLTATKELAGVQSTLIANSLVIPIQSIVERDMSTEIDIVKASLPILQLIYHKSLQELGKKSEYVKNCEKQIIKVNEALAISK